MHTIVKKKKIIELYILNWYILVYVNYILIKLIFLKKDPGLKKNIQIKGSRRF